MTTVVADISVSVDGVVTGPDTGPDNGLGTGGEALHTWAIDSDDPIDAEILAHSTERSGAVVMGRTLFVVTHDPPTHVLHLSPVVLGSGTPLFVAAARCEPVQRVVRPSRTAVHLIYDVHRPGPDAQPAS